MGAFAGVRRRWADIPVAGKMFSVVAVVIAIASGVILLSISGSHRIARGAGQVYAHGVLPTQSLGRLRAQVLEDRNLMLNYYLSDAEWRPKNLVSIKATDAEIDRVLATYGGQAADQATFAALGKNWRAYQNARDTVMIPAANRKDLPAFWTGYNKGEALSAAMDKQFDSLATSQAAEAALDNRNVDATSSHTDKVVVIGGLLALVFGVALAAFVARSVTRPLRRVTDVLTAVAGGDLTREARVDGDDEVGRMAAALNQATGSMRGTVGVITASVAALHGSSGDLARAGDEMARTATETSGRADAARAASGEVAGNVATLAAAAEQMGASIREISTNASDAASVAVEAVTSARDTTVIVGKLGDSSREIGDIVKVITSIAEQTNLLALNATIEAARAGDAGKGFAVVASEVKDLAQETARATEDIGSRVRSIQGDTTAAVEAIERVSRVIDRISDYQTTIASAVEEQTATTAEIGRSVAEAAGGADQIAVNITYVAETAHSNTRTVDQARETADALSHLAAELNDAVARFKV